MTEVSKFDASKVSEIVNSNVSKSEKIRLLKSTFPEMSEYRIAKLLGIIPQFVNNVLKKQHDKELKNATK
jgi:hypothetical protein